MPAYDYWEESFLTKESRNHDIPIPKAKRETLKEIVKLIQILADQRTDPDPALRLRRALKEVCDSVNLKIQIIEAKRRATLSDDFQRSE